VPFIAAAATSSTLLQPLVATVPLHLVFACELATQCSEGPRRRPAALEPRQVGVTVE
jgi:hypothetical protein